jgi:hypothetical protein
MSAPVENPKKRLILNLFEMNCVSTLDHLTKGPVGWNIVTSYLPNAARNFGLEEFTGPVSAT